MSTLDKVTLNRCVTFGEILDLFVLYHKIGRTTKHPSKHEDVTNSGSYEHCRVLVSRTQRMKYAGNDGENPVVDLLEANMESSHNMGTVPKRAPLDMLSPRVFLLI